MTQNSITTTVGQLLADKGGDLVKDKVVDTLVDREVEKRSEALVKVLDLIDQETKALKKIDRADQVSYDRDGKPATEFFSKARLEEISKANKKIAKMTQAVEKALQKGDFGDVYNAAQGKLKDEQPERTEGDGGEASQ